MNLPNTKEIAGNILRSILPSKEVDAWVPMLSKAMKDYVCQVLDAAAESASATTESTYGSSGEAVDYPVVDKKSISKIKELL